MIPLALFYSLQQASIKANRQVSASTCPCCDQEAIAPLDQLVIHQLNPEFLQAIAFWEE